VRTTAALIVLAIVQLSSITADDLRRSMALRSTLRFDTSQKTSPQE
jgi:hypothetical protein